MTKWLNRARSAFTLIEMLVVISIIALLMLVLLPALAESRAQARSVVCKSNLRQLLIAGIGYAIENNDFYVAAASDMLNSAGLHRWHGVRDSLAQPFDPLRSPLVAYLIDGDVKECPEIINFVKGEDWNTNFEQGSGGYGYNMLYIGSRLWQSGISSALAWKKAYEKTTRMSEVAVPSETLMFADCAMGKLDNDKPYYIEYSFAEPRFWVFDGEPLTDPGMPPPCPSLHFRHRGRTNVGWVDSHVGDRCIAPFGQESTFGITSYDMLLGWFEPLDNTMFDLQ